jgi:hypothetical protein
LNAVTAPWNPADGAALTVPGAGAAIGTGLGGADEAGGDEVAANPKRRTGSETAPARIERGALGRTGRRGRREDRTGTLRAVFMPGARSQAGCHAGAIHHFS